MIEKRKNIEKEAQKIHYNRKERLKAIQKDYPWLYKQKHVFISKQNQLLESSLLLNRL